MTGRSSGVKRSRGWTWLNDRSRHWTNTFQTSDDPRPVTEDPSVRDRTVVSAHVLDKTENPIHQTT